ncbi:UNVERIFIED_CONTAM: hypothetical protein Sangu_2152600 [Sesamum angustifolium]|uniref:Uncharacterized protein n=1 Tax=Sesamum angustifolium TaxID=2727405 RepID=A0AAW2LF89_9LAMI
MVGCHPLGRTSASCFNNDFFEQETQLGRPVNQMEVFKKVLQEEGRRPVNEGGRGRSTFSFF